MSSDERERLAVELKRAFAALPMQSRESQEDVATKAITSSAVPHVSAEGSISFTMPLLSAILSGQKTVTRRPVRPAPASVVNGAPVLTDGSAISPFASPGDRLWVREKWARLDDGTFAYALEEPTRSVRWISSRFMPRAAARHFLSVQGVSVARLSAMTEADALAEGAAADPPANLYGPLAWFRTAWDAIYGDTRFASAHDPWVWVIAFELVRS